MDFRKIFNKTSQPNSTSQIITKINDELPNRKFEETFILKNSFNALEEDFKLWSDFFHTNGYIILNNAINKEQIIKLKYELQNQENKYNKYNKNNYNVNNNRHKVHKCFF